MQKLILSFAIAGLLFACGETKEVTEATTETVEETTEIVEETTEEVTEIIEDKTDVMFDGIIRDKSKTEGCTFLIETDLGNGEVLLEPAHLDEEYKKDGLKVSFSYTFSKRPSTCGIATPILLGTITG